jgi:RNA polymerase subunit RPABC4/transcription elongation factor Spt4
VAETTRETAGNTCTRCSALLPTDAVYCGYCGMAKRSEEPLVGNSLVCTKCNKRVLAGSLFCGYCGAANDGKLAQEEQLSPPSGPDASTGFATSLFATVGGSEGMSASSEDWLGRNLGIAIGLVAVAAIITGWAFVARHKDATSDQGSHTNAASSQPSTGSASTLPASRILTKDPEFMRLLHPPQGDDLLELNTEYVRQKQEIESRLASIQDAELRKQMSDNESGKVDKSVYIQEEGETLKASFPSTMRAVLQRHRADWFEVGHIEYPGTGIVRIGSVEASPLELPDGATIPIDIATMDGVYSKFREIAQQQIRQIADAWIDAQSCAGVLPRACRNLGGTDAECSDPAKLREIEASLGQGGLFANCEANPSAEKGREIAEKKMRGERIVLIGQGDLITHRIDKLLLVDYETETALLEIPPSALNGNLEWRFPPESQPSMYSSAHYEVAPVSETAKDFGALPIHGEGSTREEFAFENTLPNAGCVESGAG